MSVDAGLSFEAQLGALREEVNSVAIAQREHRRRREAAQRDMHALDFPAVLFPVISNNLSVPTASILLGPDDGQVWAIDRVSLTGWTTADAAVLVRLWREPNLGAGQSGSQGNPQNFLAKFNDSTPGSERWGPGKGGLMLHSPDSLIITGGPFTTTTAIMLTIEGVAMESWLEADYLL